MRNALKKQTDDSSGSCGGFGAVTERAEELAVDVVDDKAAPPAVDDLPEGGGAAAGLVDGRHRMCSFKLSYKLQV